MTEFQKPQPKYTILIVDDIEMNLHLLHDTLKGEDRTILMARSGNDAFKEVGENDVDLILLDIQMPNLDGFQVAELLKSYRKTEEIPIVFVTAIHQDKSSMLRGLETGAIDYLYKPLDIDITRAKVSSVLKMIGQRNELRLRNDDLERYAVLLNNANQPMCILDSQLHNIDAVNSRFESEYGLLFSEIKGNHFFDYFKTDDAGNQAALISDNANVHKTEFRVNCVYAGKEVKWKFIEHKDKWHGLVQA